MVYHDGNKDVVIIATQPDIASQDRFYIIEVGPKQIQVSNVFGTGFDYLAVQQAQDGVRFAVPAYRTNTGTWNSDTTWSLKGQYVTGIMMAYFDFRNGEIVADDKNGSVYPGTSSGPIDRPVAQPWFSLTNENACVPASTPPCPAYLINFDRANGLVDQVDVFQSDGNILIGVSVAEPEANGMETVFTFFRGEQPCEAYAHAQQQQLAICADCLDCA
jgi:hypothetical protein